MKSKTSKKYFKDISLIFWLIKKLVNTNSALEIF
jgi:hypothetical protein